MNSPKLKASRLGASLIALAAVLAPLSVSSSPALAASECNGVDSAEAVKARYPVMETARFDLVFLDLCALQMTMFEAKPSDIDLSMYRPKSVVSKAYPESQGWRIPGDMPAITKDWKNPSNGSYEIHLENPNNYWTFIIRDKSDSIKSPSKYVRMFNYSIWAAYEAKCPTGYYALGNLMVSERDFKTSAEVPGSGSGSFPFDMACLKEELTVPMEPLVAKDQKAAWFSIDSGGSNGWLAAWGSQRSSGPMPVPNTAALPPPTFWLSSSPFKEPDEGSFRGLAIPISPPSTKSAALQPPQLNGASTLGLEKQVVKDTKLVSGLVVRDDLYKSDIEKFRKSPVYTIKMSTEWEPVNEGYLCPATGDPCSISTAVEKSTSESTTWNNTVGVAASVTVTQTAGVSVGLASAETSLSFGLEVSYSHEFGGESSSGTATTNSISNTLKPGEFGSYFRSTTRYDLFRGDGTKVRSFSGVGPTALGVYSPDPPVDTSCSAIGLNRDLVKCPLPVTATTALPRGEQVFSESGDHYLLLSNGGTLEVRESDQGVEQPDGAVWYLDKNHKYGQLDHEISSVSFIDGRIRVTAPLLPDWCSTKSTHPDAKLEITDEGVLRVVDASNPRKVYWSSSKDTSKEGGC